MYVHFSLYMYVCICMWCIYMYVLYRYRMNNIYMYVHTRIFPDICSSVWPVPLTHKSWAFGICQPILPFPREGCFSHTLHSLAARSPLCMSEVLWVFVIQFGLSILVALVQITFRLSCLWVSWVQFFLSLNRSHMKKTEQIISYSNTWGHQFILSLCIITGCGYLYPIPPAARDCPSDDDWTWNKSVSIMIL